MTLITNTSLAEYFEGSITSALANQKVDAREETVHYIVNLLSAFARAENLYDRTPDGVMMRPLASFYADAVEGATPEARNQALRRLGDLALFISGLFAESLNRKVVDVDYYISMGGGAYAHLADVLQGTFSHDMSEVYGELSIKFTDFVDVLAEVGEGAGAARDVDLMRVYELWVRTGSERARRRLAVAGIHPSSSSVSRAHH